MTLISLKGKNIEFCKGCLACQQTGKCVIKDDVQEIMDEVLNADVVVCATPIYYYEMYGQMKVMLLLISGCGKMKDLKTSSAKKEEE